MIMDRELSIEPQLNLTHLSLVQDSASCVLICMSDNDPRNLGVARAFIAFSRIWRDMLYQIPGQNAQCAHLCYAS